MAKAKNGDTVRVHYTGTLEDGTTFDSSAGEKPLEFTVGDGKLIPGFEDAIVGMNAGDSKDIEVGADEGYGERRKELVMRVSRTDLPADLDPAVGEQLEVRQEGKTFPVMVTEVSADAVTLDANHPLAGKVLKFKIELVEIL